MNTENGRITDVFIGRESHGIPTCSISIEFESTCQNFGGYDLRHESYVSFVQDTIDAVGVDSLKSLVGASCRVRRGEGRIMAIGHIFKDKWFIPGASKNTT